MGHLRNTLRILYQLNLQIVEHPELKLFRHDQTETKENYQIENEFVYEYLPTAIKFNHEDYSKRKIYFCVGQYCPIHKKPIFTTKN